MNISTRPATQHVYRRRGPRKRQQNCFGTAVALIFIGALLGYIAGLWQQAASYQQQIEDEKLLCVITQ